MRSLLFATLSLCGVGTPVWGQATLQQVASQFEQSIDCGQRIWNQQELESLLEAAVSYEPQLSSNPRIAGTDGAISANTRIGYIGGVYFGPIVVSSREIDYDRMTVTGDIATGWELKRDKHIRAISTNEHPTWLLLEDENLSDGFEVTEEQALDIVRTVTNMAEQRPRSADGTPVVPLTAGEIDRLDRFEGLFWTPPDRAGEKAPWWAGHFVITAKSQVPGSHKNVYDAGVQFAVIDGGLKFMRANPAYDVFAELGLERWTACAPSRSQ